MLAICILKFMVSLWIWYVLWLWFKIVNKKLLTWKKVSRKFSFSFQTSLPVMLSDLANDFQNVLVWREQCCQLMFENWRLFCLYLRFYVKSILSQNSQKWKFSSFEGFFFNSDFTWNQFGESVTYKTAVFCNIEGSVFCLFDKFQPSKSEICSNGFYTSRIHKIDFT